jgi:predicted RNA binding protein YcfA (HicA-like mRNA interferase family)
MAAAKTYKFREIAKKLKKHDKQFQVWTQRGKGSHRVIYHPDIQGHPVAYPIPCHNEGSDIKASYLKAIVRRFDLPEDFF